MINILCSIISNIRNPQKSIDQIRKLSPDELETLISLAYKQNLIALLYSFLVKNNLTNFVSSWQLADLQAKARLNAVNNLLLLNEAKLILGAFKKNGIPAIALKGLHLLENYFEDISLRPMIDLDLLLCKEDIPKALSILKAHDYQISTYFDFSDDNLDVKHVPPLIKNKKFHLELHWSIVAGDWPFNIDVVGLWQRAVPATVASVEALVLSVEDLLLHLCIHFSYQHHLQGGLRGLYDFIVVLEAQQWDLDWEILFQRAKKWRIERIVALTFALLAEFFNENIPQERLALLKSEMITFDLLAAAKAQVFPAQETQIAITPDLVRLSSLPGIFNKISLVLQRVFIPKSAMARLYNIPPQSIKLYFFYPMRFLQLFSAYAQTTCKILIKNKSINSSLAHEKANQDLLNWMQSE